MILGVKKIIDFFSITSLNMVDVYEYTMYPYKIIGIYLFSILSRY